MKIKKLSLKNFMGVSEFTLDLKGGKSCSVFGDNATGKSTLFSAFTYLLFGKDSLGKADFEIKTRHPNGDVVPGLDHLVGGIFEVGGEEVTLLKIYKEKYTKKRGEPTPVFTGHDTEHFIDAVPKSKGEYQAFVNSIAPEELFRLLTSPTHFNEQMKWQDRRAMLIDACGNITDSAVIAANPDLKELAGLKRSIDDEKKVAQAERKKTDDDMQAIPARIDEATKALPESPMVSASVLMEKAKVAAAELQALQQEKAVIENGGAVALKRKELAEIEASILELKNKHASVDHGKDDRIVLQRMRGEQSILSGNISGAKARLAHYEGMLEDCKNLAVQLSGQWKAENEKLFVLGGACPTCGQDYPENLVAVQGADFNRAKAINLEKIMEANKANQLAAAGCKENIVSMTACIEKLEADMVKLSRDIETTTDAINAAKGPDVTELPEYQELDAQKKTINEWFSGPGNAPISTTDISEKITAKQTEINDINLQITAIESRRTGEARIAELKAQEKDLAKKAEKVEATLFLLEKFTRAKVSMLEDSINRGFERVNFKMFDPQVNGALAETCVCMIDGVPYPSLNNAGRIQAGLDIIKTLSMHHGFSPVCWIDNRESICRIPDMPGQIISLVVSENDKKLRVEIQ